MRGPEEWPSHRSNSADRIRLTGPAADFSITCESPPTFRAKTSPRAGFFGVSEWANKPLSFSSIRAKLSENKKRLWSEGFRTHNRNRSSVGLIRKTVSSSGLQGMFNFAHFQKN